MEDQYYNNALQHNIAELNKIALSTENRNLEDINVRDKLDESIVSAKGEYCENSIIDDPNSDDTNSEVTDNSSEGDKLLNIEPVDLIMIPVDVEEIRSSALIDSGATLSFVNLTIAKKAKAKVNQREKKLVTGYGNKSKQTLGSCELKISILGISTISKFHIMHDDDLRYEVIFGVDFLKGNKMSLELSTQQIRMQIGDQSFISATMVDKDRINNFTIVNAPVYSDQNISLSKNTTKFIEVNYGVVPIMDHQLHYIEGSHRNENVDSYSGILEPQLKRVLLGNSKCNKTIKIKKGDIVGCISSMVVTDDHDQEESENWTMGRLTNEIKIDNTEITAEQKQEIYQMLLNIDSALSCGDGDIGKAKVAPHHIELHNYSPIWQRPRNFSEPINNEIEAQCEELLSNDIIEHSDSNWSSPVVPVRKPDGSLRLCIDYRKVNAVTKQENFPMPNLNQCIYRGGKMKYFTSLDLVKGYYQFELDDESKKYTAFSTTRNHFQFKRLAFGLRNSGIQFQKSMQQILAQLSSHNIIIYIDDILIMTTTYEEHIKLVQKVLLMLSKHNIKIKVKKCKFFQQSVSFLGHVMSSNGITKSPEFIQKVKDFPRPNTIKELKGFLGLANFQRKFVNHFAETAKPLTDLTGLNKRTKIIWTESRQKAFEEIKLKLEEEVVLTYPDYDTQAEKLQLFVDASDTGAGACLQQKQDGEVRTIGYVSMAFSTTQKNYSTIERELSAILFGCTKFKSFIYGIPFTLYTDHKPLIYMNNMAPHNSRIQRTLQELSEYNFNIKYQPGIFNQAADALSRMDTNLDDGNEVKDEIPKELRIFQKVEGGGNSMFLSLLLAMQEELNRNDLPTDHLELRKIVISELLTNLSKYKIPNNKHEKNKIRIMLNDNQLPCEQALLAVSKIFSIEIRVYHNMSVPVVYNAENNRDFNVINLQCISYIHYNPLYSWKPIDIETDKRNINCINTHTEIEYMQEENDNLELNVLLDDDNIQKSCHHDNVTSEIQVTINGNNLCAMVDTGAQVSVIDEEIWNEIKKDEMVEDSNWRQLSGMSGGVTEIIGVVKLKLAVSDMILEPFTFVIVKQSKLPCCILLGLNFLKHNKANIDFNSGYLHFNDESNIHINMHVSENYEHIHLNNIDQTDDEGRDDCNDDASQYNLVISEENVKVMQCRNHAIRSLFIKINKNIPISQWREVQLKQFKRYHQDYLIRNGLLYRKIDDLTPAVISFPFLVELANKVHQNLSHMGRHKLVNTIKQQFWHPAIDTVCRQISAGCEYCQLYKTSAQHITPPTLKIEASYPFQLVAVDLILFPRTSSGYSVALTVIDHYSKWLTAIPLKDKKSSTVAKALRDRVIPNLTRVPENLLSDNGTEFRGKDTEQVLESFSIKHIYSSPQNPASNGAIERVNQTLTEILKAKVQNGQDWDILLPDALITYNNSYHSQIGTTPSKKIMTQHNIVGKLPLQSSLTSKWKEGHPNFAPYSINQKVIKKIIHSDHCVSHKFEKKYDGPFIVKKVQSNGLSYEIAKEGNLSKILKVHHNHLRPWKEIPYKIKKYLDNAELEVQKPEGNIKERRQSRDSNKSIIHMNSDSSETDSDSFDYFVSDIDSDSSDSIECSSLSSESASFEDVTSSSAVATPSTFSYISSTSGAQTGNSELTKKSDISTGKSPIIQKV